ncbi:MAG: protein-disulfide reductase DsbD domain-containing protein, partial [Granulosicoccaceae bacterium]
AGASDGLGFRSRSRGDDPMPDSTGTALHALDLLFHATGERQWESAADGILATQASELTESPWRWAWLLHQWRNQRDGEISPSQWAANGQVSINAHRDGGDIVVKLNIAKGWHLQSAKPSHPDLIATKLYLNDGTAVSAKARPGAEMVATGIKNTPMSLYSGAQTLLVDTSDSAGPISLRLQACDDKLCLPPETVQLGYLR